MSQDAENRLGAVSQVEPLNRAVLEWGDEVVLAAWVPAAAFYVRFYFEFLSGFYSLPYVEAEKAVVESAS